MAYTPPDSNDVQFTVTDGYIAPAKDGVAFVIGEGTILVDLLSEIKAGAYIFHDLDVSIEAVRSKWWLSTEIKAAFKSITDLNTDIRAVRESVIDLDTDIRAYNERLTDLSTSIEAIRSKHWLKTEINVVNVSLSDLLTTISAGIVSIQDLKTSINASAQSSTDLKNSISAAFATDFKDLLSEITAGVETISDLKSEINAKAEIFYDLKSEIRGANLSLSDLLSEITAGVETISDLKSEINVVNVCLSDLLSEIITQAQKFYDLKSEIKARGYGFSDLNTSIQVLRSKWWLNTEIKAGCSARYSFTTEWNPNRFLSTNIEAKKLHEFSFKTQTGSSYPTISPEIEILPVGGTYPIRTLFLDYLPAGSYNEYNLELWFSRGISGGSTLKNTKIKAEYINTTDSGGFEVVNLNWISIKIEDGLYKTVNETPASLQNMPCDSKLNITLKVEARDCSISRGLIFFRLIFTGDLKEALYQDKIIYGEGAQYFLAEYDDYTSKDFIARLYVVG